LNSTEDEIKKIEENLQLAESHVNNADALETLNKRIKEIEGRISNLSGKIDENYTTALFDENWILVNFEKFQEEFAEKVEAHSKIKKEAWSGMVRELINTKNLKIKFNFKMKIQKAKLSDYEDIAKIFREEFAKYPYKVLRIHN
jgi:hypothetical protein